MSALFANANGCSMIVKQMSVYGVGQIRELKALVTNPKVQSEQRKLAAVSKEILSHYKLDTAAKDETWTTMSLRDVTFGPAGLRRCNATLPVRGVVYGVSAETSRPGVDLLFPMLAGLPRRSTPRGDRVETLLSIKALLLGDLSPRESLQEVSRTLKRAFPLRSSGTRKLISRRGLEARTRSSTEFVATPKTFK